jgi:hypothetical protein
MKKFVFYLGLFFVLAFAGCFEITDESTIHKDGSGVYTKSTDLSQMIAMLKMMGGDEAKEMENLKKDTVISLATLKDSIPNLSDKEKKLLEKSSLKVLLDMPEEKFQIAVIIPFSEPADMGLIYELVKKTGGKAIEGQMNSLMGNKGSEGKSNSDGNDDSGIPDLDKYFDYTYRKGKISKKLNKEKYATVAQSEELKSLKDITQLGGEPMKMKVVYNLPQKAKKAEGKGLVLSEDKMKVTIESTIDDFFDKPEMMEYEIEY